MQKVVCRQTGANEWSVYRGAQAESVKNREVYGNGPLYCPAMPAWSDSMGRIPRGRKP
jgi:hypothetical protein